jgi:(S)-2-hydroxyglutarate dehydrogenase
LVRADFCIIGGGIVGLATAHAILTRRPDASVVVLEKEATLGQHQTGRNSGVIHSGIYYAPGSLKAQLCREGADRTKQFCRDHGIPFEQRGKLIVATRPVDLPRLHALRDRASVNGITVEHLTAGAISEREPHVTGLEALFVPAAAIVSYGAILQALAGQVTRLGGVVRLSTVPQAIRETGNDVQIDTSSAAIHAGRLIACAGLQSDRIAHMAGVPITHRIVPFRGEYYRLSPGRNSIVDAMIYPVPDPDLPFLGVHLTPMIDGSISVGPNAMLGLAREGYAKGAVNLRDMADMLGFPGFWRAMGRNIGPGLTELGNSLFKRRYLAACQKYCPDLQLDDLHPMPAGIRAQAVLRDGTMVHDFLFAQTDRMLHVCNAPSPAATSALPIGDMIADKVL